jgi:hypothetical protein
LLCHPDFAAVQFAKYEEQQEPKTATRKLETCRQQSRMPWRSNNAWQGENSYPAPIQRDFILHSPAVWKILNASRPVAIAGVKGRQIKPSGHNSTEKGPVSIFAICFANLAFLQMAEKKVET